MCGPTSYTSCGCRCVTSTSLVLPPPHPPPPTPFHRTTIGFRVITVPEIATPMLYNTGGYEPSWQSTTKHVTLQTVFLKAQVWETATCERTAHAHHDKRPTEVEPGCNVSGCSSLRIPSHPFSSLLVTSQVAQEDAYRAIAALRPETPCVILHDRGALDGRSFCTRQEWASVIRAVGTSERSLYARYGLVLHLASTASEAQYERLYEYGTDSNNPSRFHNVEQAKEADRMSQKVRVTIQERWRWYPRFCASILIGVHTERGRFLSRV